VVGRHLTHLLVSPGDVWSETQEFNSFTYPLFSYCSVLRKQKLYYTTVTTVITDPCEYVSYPLLGFYKQGIIPVITAQLSAWLRQVMSSVLLNTNL
jgi:hypothetical protein